MYQARTRELNSTLSTFVQQDMGYFGGANLYQAIGSQPTTSVDPFGLVPSDHRPPQRHSHSRRKIRRRYGKPCQTI
jgi:hypothetical protein